jgi:ATP-dependent DNA helicase RecQ
VQAREVLEQLEQRGGVDLRSLGDELAQVDGDEVDRWRWLARQLVQEDLISESDDGSQRLWLRPAGRRFLQQPWPLRLVA